MQHGRGRYANRETIYLFQRIEPCEGPAVITTNIKSIIDAAFSRQCMTTPGSRRPDKEERVMSGIGYFAAAGSGCTSAACLQSFTLSVEICAGAACSPVCRGEHEPRHAKGSVRTPRHTRCADNSRGSHSRADRADPLHVARRTGGPSGLRLMPFNGEPHRDRSCSLTITSRGSRCEPIGSNPYI